jgi:hypothetical protein
VTDEDRRRQPQRIDELEHVAPERGELAAAQRLRVEESRRVVAAQRRREHAQARFRERGRDLAPALGAVGPAMEQQRAARRAPVPLEITHLELRRAHEGVRHLKTRRS